MVSRRTRAERCSTGQAVDFRTYAGKDYLSVVAADSPLVPELIAWTADRFAGKAAANNCGS